MLKDVNLRKKNKGFTLIEILLVVGFIALAGIGVYIIYDKVETTHAANTEARNFDAILADIKSLYQNSPNYTGISALNLVQAKIIPDYMITGPADAPIITNKFGATFTFHDNSSGMFNKSTMIIVNMPAKYCFSFVKAISNNALRINMMGSGQHLVKNLGIGTKKPELDVNELSVKCSQSGSTAIARINY